MANITSAKKYIQAEGGRFRGAVSEGLMQAMGGTVNWLLQKADAIDATISGINSTIAAFNRLRLVSDIAIAYSSAGIVYAAPSGNYAIVMISSDGGAVVKVDSGGGGGTLVADGAAFLKPGQRIVNDGSGTVSVSGIAFQSVSGA